MEILLLNSKEDKKSDHFFEYLCAKLEYPENGKSISIKQRFAIAKLILSHSRLWSFIIVYIRRPFNHKPEIPMFVNKFYEF